MGGTKFFPILLLLIPIMVRFTTTIKQFDAQGEKTGWTYIEIPAAIAQQLKPDNKQSFRVKGKLDDYAFQSLALLPMGGGDFILALNAGIRKQIHKRKGATLRVQMTVDEKPLELSAEFLECLADEPKALAFFKTLPRSHQLYFSKWIESAKTESTRARRLAQAVNKLARGLRFNEMMRVIREEKNEWGE